MLGTCGPFPCANVLGVPVSVCTVDSVANQVVDWARGPVGDGGTRLVCATSVHGVMEAQRDPAFLDILNRASIVTPDGMPLAWLGRLQGFGQMERVYGPDVMLEVCGRSAPLSQRHFFYGGAPGVAEALARSMALRFPDLTVAGTYCPPFRALSTSELRQVAEAINEADTDILWVGLSTPTQERWAAAIQANITAKVTLTVGAAFDFHIGRVRQAPHWMQARGLEWFYRLTQEPRRLWRRYLRNNPAFAWLALLQIAGLRAYPLQVAVPAQAGAPVEADEY